MRPVNGVDNRPGAYSRRSYGVNFSAVLTYFEDTAGRIKSFELAGKLLFADFGAETGGFFLFNNLEAVDRAV